MIGLLSISVTRRGRLRVFKLLALNLDGPPMRKSVRSLMREHRLSFPILRGSEDVAAIYNILYRYLFDPAS